MGIFPHGCGTQKSSQSALELRYCGTVFGGGIMRTFICAAIMLIAVALSAPFTGSAFAQAGSTGGTLGNTDKSISGEREQPRRSTSPERHTAPKVSSPSTEKTAAINLS